jgi:hypothetical protein
MRRGPKSCSLRGTGPERPAGTGASSRPLRGAVASRNRSACERPLPRAPKGSGTFRMRSEEATPSASRVAWIFRRIGSGGPELAAPHVPPKRDPGAATRTGPGGFPRGA